LIPLPAWAFSSITATNCPIASLFVEVATENVHVVKATAISTNQPYDYD
jgi:hypothetical protein